MSPVVVAGWLCCRGCGYGKSLAAKALVDAFLTAGNHSTGTGSYEEDGSRPGDCHRRPANANGEVVHQLTERIDGRGEHG